MDTPATSTGILIVSSPEFVPGGMIPKKYTCHGARKGQEGYENNEGEGTFPSANANPSGGINPPLVIDQIPDGTHTMALIMEDPDAPNDTVTHWIAWDILPANSISENTQPGISGLNSAGTLGYLPPCPKSGAHRYFFHIFALDSGLDLRTGSDRSALESAMAPHILATGTLIGRISAP
jgi:Raf kinase inhibitor-like YbhB/YbcL family protein